MMSELFDEEYLRKQYDLSERKKSFAEGRAEGRAEGKAEGRAEGKAEGRAEGKAEGESKAVKTIAQKLREMGLSDEQIKKATSI